MHYILPEKKPDILRDLEKYPQTYDLFQKLQEHHVATYQHLVRVALVTDDFAQRQGFSPEDCFKARTGALLNDL